MHATVYKAFEEICASAGIQGAVLEVGATPGPDSLLRLACLAANVSLKIGLNLLEAGDCGTYTIVRGDANDMNQFTDGQFNAVLCNATLEHDRFFWRTLAEIRRVTKSGGFIAIGVPGYAGMGLANVFPPRSLLRSALRLLGRGRHGELTQASTITLGVHNYPGDYYRFSEQAVREVFMEGLAGVTVRTVLKPPRFIAWGRKP